MGNVFLHEQSGTSSDIGSNANLTINCQSGSVVTISCGETEYVSVSDMNGRAVFTGLTHGTWDVTVEYEGAVYSESVEVVTDYEVTIERVLYKGDVYYPASCEAYTYIDGVKYSAPDTSGVWHYESYCKPDKFYTFNGDVEKVKNTVFNSKTTIKPYDYSQTFQQVDLTSVMSYIYVNLSSEAEQEITYTAPSGKVYTGVTNRIDADELGTWTVECIINGITVTKTVDVDEDMQSYHVSFADYVAIIDVTYPEGARCICACTENGVSDYAPDASGRWYFFAPNTGTWTFTANDAYQTVSKTVYITATGQHETINIKFFAATINITYPVGATCTCTDGINTFTAPDTSGTWKLTVPRIGDWQIKAVNGNREVESEVTISYDGQTAYKTLEFFESYINVSCNTGMYKIVLYSIDSYGSETEISTVTGGYTSRKFTVYKAGDYKVAAYRVEPTVGIESDSGKYTTAVATITASKQTVSVTMKFCSIPEFTYTGKYEIVADPDYDPYGVAMVMEAGPCEAVVIDDEIIEEVIPEEMFETPDLEAEGKTTYDPPVEYVISEEERSGWYGNWNIKFLEGGTLKFTKLNGASTGVDIFACGGGGNGGEYGYQNAVGDHPDIGGGGGGGGYRQTSFEQSIELNKTYVVTIGGAGGESSITSSSINIRASGGADGGDSYYDTNSGDYVRGSGGSGGSAGGYIKESGYYGMSGEDGAYAFMGTCGRRYGAGGGPGVSMWRRNSDCHSYLRIYDGSLGGLHGGGSCMWYNNARNRVVNDALSNSGGGGSGEGWLPDYNDYYKCNTCGDIYADDATLIHAVSGGSGIVIIRNAR